MINGSYSLHLYCDSGKSLEEQAIGHAWTDGDSNPDEIYGRNERECRQVAKRKGWILRGDRAICPTCAKAGCK